MIDSKQSQKNASGQQMQSDKDDVGIMELFRKETERGYVGTRIGTYYYGDNL